MLWNIHIAHFKPKSTMRNIRNIYLGLTCIVLSFSVLCCTESQNYSNNINTPTESEIFDLLVDEATNSLIKYKRDTLLLQQELQKSKDIEDTVLQIAINKQLGEIHAENFHSRSAVLNKRAYLLLTQGFKSPAQELIALNDIASYFLNVEILDDALRFYFESLEISKELNSKNKTVIREIARSNLGIGAVYTQFENKDHSNYWLDKSMQLVNIINDKELKSDIFIVKGMLSKEKLQYDSAKIYFDRALEGYIAINSTSGLGLSLLELGKLSIDLNDYSSAIISLENTLGVLEGTSEKVNIMKSHLLLGRAYLKLYNYTKAEEHIIEASRLSKNINSSVHNRNANLALSEMYLAQNNIPQSVYYNDLARKYDAEINKIKIQAGIFNAYMAHESSKNKQEIADIKTNYRLKSKIKNMVIISTLFTIALLIILFFLFDRYWKARRERNESIISSALLKVNLFNHISKELKSPLAIIDGLVERLKTSVSDTNRTSEIINLEIIERQTQNISFLINETLSLSQSKYNVKAKWVNGNIVDFLRYIHNSFKDDAESRGANMMFLTNQQEINMNFCRERLQLVIINILYITIRNSVKDDKIFLSVNYNDTDTTCQISIVHKSVFLSGDEIPLEFRDLMSEYNKSEQRPYKNFSLLRRTVEDMGGTFSLHGERENDTSFNMSFPIKNNKKLEKYSETEDIIEPAPKPAEEGVYAIPSQNVDDRSDKETIMIVEENQFMSFYISSLINSKYNIVTCQSAVEALKQIEKSIPDLIITDLMLPQMDGNQLTEILKKTPSTSHIPIIMSITKGANNTRIKSIKSGVDAFLVKPFVEEELHALVEQLLRSRKGLLKKIAQTFIEKQTNRESIMDDDDIVFIQKVSEIIHREISNFELSTQLIAEKMHMSTSHLNRKIKSMTDLSTTGYILSIRLNKAKKVLITTQKAIGEVAMECGFSDFAYFSRTFKKEFGITPSQYQRMSVE